MANSNPLCPRCETNRGSEPVGGGQFKCGVCRGLYDSNPDEHGHAIHRDPERNAQSKEEYQLRQKQRAMQKQQRRKW